MMKLKTLWRPLSLIFYVGVFVYYIIYEKAPLTTIILPYILFFVLTKLIFIADTIASMGLFLHIFTRNDRKARPFYAAANRLRTTKINAIATYALMLLKEGKISEAKGLYDRMLTFKNVRPTLYKIICANLAICSWKLGDLDSAVEQYEGLAESETYRPLFTADDYTTLGYLYLEQGNYEKAFQFTSLALNLDEEHVSALDNMGQLHYRQNKLEEAVNYFNKAIEIKEYYVDSNYWLGRILEEKQDFEGAKSHYTNALEGSFTALNTVTKEEIQLRLDQIPTL